MYRWYIYHSMVHTCVLAAYMNVLVITYISEAASNPASLDCLMHVVTASASSRMSIKNILEVWKNCTISAKFTIDLTGLWNHVKINQDMSFPFRTPVRAIHRVVQTTSLPRPISPKRYSKQGFKPSAASALRTPSSASIFLTKAA